MTPAPPSDDGPIGRDPWRAVEALEALSAASSRSATGWRRIVPVALTSTTRQASWRRTRARRVVAALLAGAAVWVALTALAPHPVPTGVPVVVAARDLAVGALVVAGDLRLERRPGPQLPAGVVRSTADAAGQVTAGSVRAGEVLTSARFRGPSQLRGLTGSDVALSVPLVDDGLLASVRPGDAVTVLSPGTGAVVAPAARVLSVDAPSDGVLGETGDAAGRVVLALSDREARAVAATIDGPAGVTGFVIALRPD